MSTAVHTLPEVAAMWRIEGDAIRWITRRIKSGKFRARRIGRTWVMTDADLDYNLDQLANVTVTIPEKANAPAESTTVGMPSLASMRRRRSA